LRGEFNGHIGTKANRYDVTHEGLGYGERNSRRVAIMDFVVSFELTIINFLFKKEDQLISDL